MTTRSSTAWRSNSTTWRSRSTSTLKRRTRGSTSSATAAVLRIRCRTHRRAVFMLPERFWKRFNKTICKLFRAGAGYFRTVRKCVKGGYSLSRKRVSHFATPERKDEGPSPSTPHIARLQLEELHALRNRVRCTWLRHESLRFVTNRNRALLREARVTVARRQTACGRHCCARRGKMKSYRLTHR